VRQTWGYFGNNSTDPVPETQVIMDIDPANVAAHRKYFFKHVHSEMISDYFEGCLSKAALKQLELKKRIQLGRIK